jgi:tetratricopeptide (TPR) repeat protein
MGFEAQSATGVPRPQRRISGYFRARAWLLGRALRGCSHTALLVLVSAHSARAQSAARFADAPANAPSSAMPSATPAAPPTNAAASPAPALPNAAASPQPATPATPTAASGPAPAGGGWTRNLALSHFERALRLEQRGDLAQALSEYTQSLAIDSTLGEAYLRLGALRERMGDAREAALVYSEAVRLGDTRARALVQRSRLFRAAGRGAEALRDLEAAVALEPNREALSELANDYVELHAFAAALFTVRRLLASAQVSGDNAAEQSARLEVRALRVLAAETDPTAERAPKHDWVGRSLASIARR